MSPKHSVPSKASGTEPKRQRKMLTIAEKVELLDMLKERGSYEAVGHHYRVNESLFRYIKNKKNIKTMAAVSFNKAAKREVTSCNKSILRIEFALALWISDCRRSRWIPTPSA